MKLTFVSNYINHHQIPLSKRLYARLGSGYSFIQTEPMEEERMKMGWGAEVCELPYLKCFYEKPEECRGLILDSDVVIFGGTEDESYIEPRLRAGGPVIRYSERLYREGQWKAVSPRGLLKKYRDHTRYRKSPVYLLCAGAYVAGDFAIVQSYPGKRFQWGYFPEVYSYDVKKLMAGKAQDRVELLWAGRFLPLKHPEYALALAGRLKAKGYAFHLTMVGGGAMESQMKEDCGRLGLADCVTFTGFQRPEAVRRYMERANVFLFTSNYLEGWGAVLNEAMNSGCGVVADAKIGAVPFLLTHEKNGLVYRDGCLEEFLAYGERLTAQKALRENLGRAAYQTVQRFWNPNQAAQALLDFSEGILQGELRAQEEGPLSKALVIWPGKGYAYTRRNKKREKS